MWAEPEASQPHLLPTCCAKLHRQPIAIRRFVQM